MAGIDAARFRPAAAPARAPPGYGDAAYWDARYQAANGHEPYDWYLQWEQLSSTLMPVLTSEDNPDGREAQILVVGCGTSSLSEQLYAEGFTHIVNVDRCADVVDFMRQKHQDLLEGGGGKDDKKGGKKGGKDAKTSSPDPDLEARVPMQFAAVDVGELPQDWAGRFDVVIDKALLDATLCGLDKWARAETLLSAVRATLKPGGTYLCVSHAGPEARVPVLLGQGVGQRADADVSQAYGWTISRHSIQRPLANPVADPKAKDKIEIVPSPAYREEQDHYHVYTCQTSAV